MALNLREKFLETFAENCIKSTELTRRKGEGYTAGVDDPYKNFRFAAEMSSLPGENEDTVETTILSRMADKISRFKSLIVRPGAAYDESMEDTLMDLLTYANILLTFVQLGRPEPGVEFSTSEELIINEVPANVPIMEQVKQTGRELAKLFNWPTEPKK